MANTTSTLTSKIGYQIRGDNSNESSFINTTTVLYSGVGSGQADYGIYNQVELAVGEQIDLDFTDLEKPVFDVVASGISYQNIKAIGIYNEETQTGNDISINVTGNGLTEIFNGGTGNVLVKPYGVYQYSDVTSGVIVDSSNKELSIVNEAATGVTVSYAIIGVTGA